VRRIAFWHRKGGTGKTSLAIGCALSLAAQGARVLLLDVDPQGTAAAWGDGFADAAGVVVRSDRGAAIWRDLPSGPGRFDAVLLDCPPTVSAEVLTVLAGVDHLVIPTRPAWPDVWALESVAVLLDDLRRGGAQIRARVLFNQIDDESTAAFESVIAGWGLPLCTGSIARSAEWAELFMGGPPPRALERVLPELLA
jgi:chromosome partitioning protein